MFPDGAAAKPIFGKFDVGDIITAVNGVQTEESFITKKDQVIAMIARAPAGRLWHPPAYAASARSGPRRWPCLVAGMGMSVCIPIVGRAVGVTVGMTVGRTRRGPNCGRSRGYDRGQDPLWAELWA